MRALVSAVNVALVLRHLPRHYFLDAPMAARTNIYWLREEVLVWPKLPSGMGRGSAATIVIRPAEQYLATLTGMMLTDLVNQQVLTQCEYLVAENRILRAQPPGKSSSPTRSGVHLLKSAKRAVSFLGFCCISERQTKQWQDATPVYPSESAILPQTLC